MLSENAFVTLFDLSPLTLFKLKKDRKVSKYFKLVIVLCLVTNLTIDLYTILQIPLVDIPSLIYTLNLAYYICSCVFSLWLLLLYRSVSVDFLHTLGELDSSLDVLSLSSQPDRFLSTLSCLITLHVLSSLWFIQKAYQLYFVTDFLSVTFMVQLAALKQMLSKRLGVIVNRSAGSGGLTETLERSREILSLNEEVNARFSLLVVGGLTGDLLHFLFSMVAYWRVYGLHDSYDSFELQAPVLTMFGHGYFVVKLLLISWSSTKLSGYVNELYFEIQRKITIQEKSRLRRLMLLVLQLELSHTAVDFTALELLSVDNSSVTDVCGFVVNCMMVFVQFLSSNHDQLPLSVKP